MTNKERRKLMSLYCKKYINFRLCKKQEKLNMFQRLENMLITPWDREILYAIVKYGGMTNDK